MPKEKKPIRNVNGTDYLRILIKTKIFVKGDDPGLIAAEVCKEQQKPGDIIAISSKVVAVTQGRAIPETQIKIGLMARIMWRFVRKVSYGIGLRSPATFQSAINECGHIRILAASVVGVLGKLIGRRGDFYRVAGMQAATIDAAHTCPIPPYDQCVILGPLNPDGAAEDMKKKTGLETAVMDINDIGGSWVLGCSSGIDKKLLQDIMRDNPMGQKSEQTPICLVRKIS
jgi:hypothetical protein